MRASMYVFLQVVGSSPDMMRTTEAFFFFDNQNYRSFDMYMFSIDISV